MAYNRYTRLLCSMLCVSVVDVTTALASPQLLRFNRGRARHRSCANYHNQIKLCADVRTTDSHCSLRRRVLFTRV
eukprot:1808332-Pyramimonas_sp.AAC.2